MGSKQGRVSTEEELQRTVLQETFIQAQGEWQVMAVLINTKWSAS